MRPADARALGPTGTPTLPVILVKETFGSPKFPSYPCEHMPWSKAPVVSRTLAMSHSGLLPSNAWRSSAFPPNLGRIILSDHNYEYFGAQYRACTLVPSGFGLPLPGLPSDFTAALLARL
jgi:hypothetical protein